MSLALASPTPQHPGMTTLDPLLTKLAADQHGVFTTAQATGVGISAPMLVKLVRGGALQHPGRGVYVVASMAAEEADRRHLQLCAGALLLYPDAVLSGTSALLAHGIPVWGADLGRPSIRRPVDRSRGMAALWVRPSAGKPVTTSWGPAQRLPDALVEHALDRGIAPGVVSADAALRSGATTPEELDVATARVLGWPRGSRARAMLAHADGRRESVGESRCGLALSLAGIDVQPQQEIRASDGTFVARVDFLVQGTNVVIEFDGKVKYGSGDPEVLWAEKRREDRMRRLGYVVVRVTWADLEHPGAVAAKVRTALRAA
jgi:very-short-patch-repair endonuclease